MTPEPACPGGQQPQPVQPFDTDTGQPSGGPVYQCPKKADDDDE
jgi:hypothetical protein